MGLRIAYSTQQYIKYPIAGTSAQQMAAVILGQHTVVRYVFSISSASNNVHLSWVTLAGHHKLLVTAASSSSKKKTHTGESA